MVYILTSMDDNANKLVWPRDRHQARGRSYRSELDILRNILEFLDSHGDLGVKKTRIIQYANLNSSSFQKYMDMLMSMGLCVVKDRNYTITPRGRLMLRILELYSILLSPLTDYPQLIDLIRESSETLGISVAVPRRGFADLILYRGDRNLEVILLSRPCSADCLDIISSLLTAAKRRAQLILYIIISDQTSAYPVIRRGRSWLSAVLPRNPSLQLVAEIIESSAKEASMIP